MVEIKRRGVGGNYENARGRRRITGGSVQPGELNKSGATKYVGARNCEKPERGRNGRQKK